MSPLTAATVSGTFPSMSAAPRIFTSRDLATFCQVDGKTVHNWADKGAIRCFRTPGRHLRFKAVDVAEFLAKFGYDIPSSVIEAQATAAA